VIVGFNREEAETFPDNTRAFLDRANAALNYSTAPGVQIEAPTADLDKAAIVARGRELGAPLELVWVCYEGGEEHCGTCESCRRFERALERAGAHSWWTALRAEARGEHKHA
jgi:7-cyano-7-deazaguanine synthase